MNNWTLIILGALAVLLIIILIRRGAEGKQANTVVQATPAGPSVSPVAGVEPAPGGQADAELVAVIAAAIATSTGQAMDAFVVRKISRASGHAPIWATAGRQECVDSRRL